MLDELIVTLLNVAGCSHRGPCTGEQAAPVEESAKSAKSKGIRVCTTSLAHVVFETAFPILIDDM